MHLSAVSVIRVLANASNRLLVSATNGRYYVLKLYDRETRSRALLNESFGAELAAGLDLSVPRWCPIYISKKFIHAFAHVWTGQEDRRPEPGYYFGSEIIGQNLGGEVCDMLPRSWMGKIENRSDFVGALFLDVWASNARARQAVFLQEPDGRMRAYFIGFKDMFSDRASISPSVRTGRYSDKRIYEGIWSESVFSLWQQKILSVKESELRQVLHQLPGVWAKCNHADQIISSLLSDQHYIGRLSI